jgi:hypothetical protein
MSLETQIADLIVALNANTAALLAKPVTAAAPAAAEEPKKTRAKKTEEAAPAAAPAAAPTPAPEPAKVETPAVVCPTVQDVRTAAQALLDANENKDDGLFATLNAKYGVKRVSETPETARAEVIAAINNKTEEVKAAKSSATNAI